MNFSDFFSVLFLGIGLSMDAFAVSVCKGLSVGKVRIKHILTAGLWFGVFQAAMPLTGYLLGTSFSEHIGKFNRILAFILLLIIGVNMLREALAKEEDAPADASFGFRTMLIMAFATSIDAFAAGIALAMDKSINIAVSVLIIGLSTFLISGAGIKIGAVFGERYKTKAKIAGGIILILIGIKILFQQSGGI